jgi:hypothetical protein
MNNIFATSPKAVVVLILENKILIPEEYYDFIEILQVW